MVELSLTGSEKCSVLEGPCINEEDALRNVQSQKSVSYVIIHCLLVFIVLATTHTLLLRCPCLIVLTLDYLVDIKPIV